MKNNRKGFPHAKLVPQANCPYEQSDIDVIGPALLALAEKNSVEIPQLTAKLALSALEKDPGNPLWGYLNTDSKKAMRAWLLDQIDHLMSCVRVVYTDIPNVKPTALFISLPDTSATGDGGTGRAKVVSLDAIDKTEIAHRIADEQVKRIRQAFEAFESWNTRAELKPAYRQLAQALGRALATFDKHNEAG